MFFSILRAISSSVKGTRRFIFGSVNNREHLHTSEKHREATFQRQGEELLLETVKLVAASLPAQKSRECESEHSCCVFASLPTPQRPLSRRERATHSS